MGSDGAALASDILSAMLLPGGVPGGTLAAMHDAPEIIAQLVARFDNDTQIDRLVYDLYGLTDDEIKLVEEATA